MSDIHALREGLVASILTGPGEAQSSQRRAAFDGKELAEPLQTLLEKVARRPREVRDEDLAAARASGITQDELFELMVCAAVGQANRQYESARTALDAAPGKE